MRSPRRLAALALFGIWFVSFGPMLLADVAPYYRDQLLTFVPVRQYLSARLLGGELPQWYPYEAIGVPFIGQMQTATFHPATLLFLPFEPVFAVKLQTLLCYLLALCGAYRAARALPVSRAPAIAAASAFALGGYALGVSHNPSYLLAHATAPWVLWAALRLCVTASPRHSSALGIFWALVLLAGDAQAFLGCGLLVGAAALAMSPGRRAVVLGLGGGVLAALLVCAELLPALAISRDSIRVLGSSDPMLGRVFSFHPLRAFEFLIPNPLPNDLRVEVTTPLFHDGGALWATTIFAGAACVALACAGISRRRQAVVFVAFTLLFVWLASGSHGGLLELLRRPFGVLSQFRFPEKYLGLAWLGFAMLVALGAEDAVARPRRAAVIAAGLAVLLGAGAALVIPAQLAARVFALANNGIAPAFDVVEATSSAWLFGGLLSAGFAAALAALLFVSRTRPRMLYGVPALCAAELLFANVRHLPMADRALLTEPSSFAQALKAAGPLPRVVSLAGGKAKRTVTGDDLGWLFVMRQLLRADESGRFGIGAIGFNLPATSLRAWRAFGAQASNRGQAGPLFGACFRIEDANAAQQPVVVDNELSLALSRTPCRPRAYLSRVLSAKDDRAAWAELRAGLADGESIWEGGPELSGGGVATIEVDAPEHLVLRVVADAPAALIINDQFARGWTATIDGAEAQLHAANVTARGIEVPAGEHRVELRYRTPNLALGALLSLLGIVAAIALIIAGRRNPSPTRAAQ